MFSIDDERALRRAHDAVAARHDERRHGRRGDRRRDRVPPLGEVDLPVPLAPRLGRREHPAAAAHVAEGGLAGAVGATALDARDTRDGAARTPRRGRGHLARVLIDAVRLALVERDPRVDEVDDVGADRREEDAREGRRRRGRRGVPVDAEYGAGWSAHEDRGDRSSWVQ